MMSTMVGKRACPAKENAASERRGVIRLRREGSITTIGMWVSKEMYTTATTYTEIFSFQKIRMRDDGQ